MKKQLLFQLFVCILILSNLHAAEKQITKIDNATISFRDMPEAILIHEIFPRLDPKDLTNASETCSQWFYIINDVTKINKNGFKFNQDFPFIKALLAYHKEHNLTFNFEQLTVKQCTIASRAIARQIMNNCNDNKKSLALIKKIFKPTKNKLTIPSFVSDKPKQERNPQEIADLMLLTAAFGAKRDFKELLKLHTSSFANKINPLQAAIQHNNNPMINYLLKLGTYNSLADEQGNSILHYAAKNRFITTEIFNKIKTSCVAHQLIAPTNGREKTALTALIVALQYSNKRAVELLLPVTNLKDSSGKTIFHDLTNYQNPIAEDILDIIPEEADLNAVDKNDNNQTALHLAAYRNNIWLTRYLLKRKVNQNLLTVQGNTPLHRASYYGNFEIAKLLIESNKNQNLNIVNKLGETPLWCAVQSKNTELVDYLIQQGVDVNIAAANVTPLHNAVNNNCIDIVKLLLEHNADQNKGLTPLLHTACLKGYYDIVELLLQHGSIDVNQVDACGQTPLSYAIQCLDEQKGLKSIKLLLQHSANINKQFTPVQEKNEYAKVQIHPILKAIWYVRKDIINHLLDRSVDIDTTAMINYTEISGNNAEILKIINDHDNKAKVVN